MKSIKKFSKLCEKCGSHNLKTCQRTYPVKMESKQINIGRVWVKECTDCHHIKPTKAGEEKIARCTMTMFAFIADK